MKAGAWVSNLIFIGSLIVAAETAGHVNKPGVHHAIRHFFHVKAETAADHFIGVINGVIGKCAIAANACAPVGDRVSVAGLYWMEGIADVSVTSGIAHKTMGSIVIKAVGAEGKWGGINGQQMSLNNFSASDGPGSHQIHAVAAGEKCGRH